MRPLVAIVGRPNVGKSSLFNRLVGQPIAIVDPTPGTTRDRLLHVVRREGLRFDLVDTGGIGIVDEAKLETDVYRQVKRAVDTADRIIFLVDGRSGCLPLDREIAAGLRPVHDRVTVVVNKLDHDGLEHEIHQFHGLGLGEPLALSAAQGRGIITLFEQLLADCPAMRDDGTPDEPEDGRIRLCLVGRRNVGKSSLTNALCGEERVIAADLPGTTRDAIDVPVASGGGRFTLIDTAGLRKRTMIDEDLEFYAACRTERAIRRAHVALLVLDATDEIAAVDKQIAHFCEVEGKPTILVVNKWDLAERQHASRGAYLEWLKDRLPALRFAPAVFTSALTERQLAAIDAGTSPSAEPVTAGDRWKGLDVDALLRLADEMVVETRSRVPTSQLNDLLEAAVQRRRPKKVGPVHTRIYYGTQAEVAPPTFIVFVNRTDWIESGYSRYLEHYLRDHLPFSRVPLKILFKARDSQRHEHEDRHIVVRARPKAEREARLVLPKDLAKRFHRRRRPDDGAAADGSGPEDEA
jgi:GTP-binding protein